jgi:hypothetical protein
LPTEAYVHVACGANRVNGAKPDIGAVPFGQSSAEPLGPDRCQEKSTNNH